MNAKDHTGFVRLIQYFFDTDTVGQFIASLSALHLCVKNLVKMHSETNGTDLVTPPFPKCSYRGSTTRLRSYDHPEYIVPYRLLGNTALCQCVKFVVFSHSASLGRPSSAEYRTTKEPDGGSNDARAFLMAPGLCKMTPMLQLEMGGECRACFRTESSLEPSILESTRPKGAGVCNTVVVVGSSRAFPKWGRRKRMVRD